MYLVKVGEIFLKGGNRARFYGLLCDNISRILGCDRSKVWYKNNIVFVDVADGARLGDVFGIHSYLKVVLCDFDAIGDVAVSLVGDEKTFAVRCSRSTKEFKSSGEVEREVGAFVVEQCGLKVNLTQPELTIFVTIFSGKAYVGADLQYGLGGLPVGCEGSVFLEVGAERESVVAGCLLMKRGCSLVLSSSLPLLQRFDASLGVGVRGDLPLAVADCSLRDGFVLQPLVGYSGEEVESLFAKCSAATK